MLWHGHLGIEPSTQGFGDLVAALEHLPVYRKEADYSEPPSAGAAADY